MLLAALIYDRLPSIIRYKFNKLPYWIKFILNLINYLGKKIYSNYCVILIVISFYIALVFLHILFIKFGINRTVRYYVWPAELFCRNLWIIYFFANEILSSSKFLINYWFSAPRNPNRLFFMLNIVLSVIILLHDWFPKYE